MPSDGDARSAKHTLRFQLRARRARRPTADRERAAEALADGVLALPEICAAATVACYVSTPEEPGTCPLLERLAALRRTVLLPVLLRDFDLEWAASAPGALRAGRLGIPEPTGEPLGVDAVTGASVVVCPGLAADDHGCRLGRGGGSYDRVLARLPPTVLRVVLLYDDEVLPAVPVDSHDQPVDVVITPRRTLRTAPAQRHKRGG